MLITGDVIMCDKMFIWQTQLIDKYHRILIAWTCWPYAVKIYNVIEHTGTTIRII